MERNATNYYNQAQSKVFTCNDCGRQRGKSIYTACDSCQGPVCVNCRGMRMLPHKCKRCKSNEEAFKNQQPATTVASSNKTIRLADKMAEIENYYIDGNEQQANDMAEQLFRQIMTQEK